MKNGENEEEMKRLNAWKKNRLKKIGLIRRKISRVTYALCRPRKYKVTK